MVVPDTRADPRFRDNPSRSPTTASAYAGVPLLLDGRKLGTLAVMEARRAR